MRYFTDPQTGDVVHCENCALFPATSEVDYTDANGKHACDMLCDPCSRSTQLQTMTTEHTAPHRPLRTWVVADLVSRLHAETERSKMLLADHPEVTSQEDLEREVLTFLQMNRWWKSDEDPPTDEEERRAACQYSIVEWAYYMEDLR